VAKPVTDRVSLGALTVAYEVEQVTDAALTIDADSTLPIHYALLDSTLLHGRALIEFLLNGTEKRDIRPRDLCPGWYLPGDDQGTIRTGSWASKTPPACEFDGCLHRAAGGRWLRLDPVGADRRGTSRG
jgi:hypothetical protein